MARNSKKALIGLPASETRPNLVRARSQADRHLRGVVRLADIRIIMALCALKFKDMMGKVEDENYAFGD